MLRQKALEKEKLLSSFAAKSEEYQNTREICEEPCRVRTAFVRDCHRIVHSKSFRRLRGKTQVFLWPQGDHYRTRMTHCMEVAQIARTIARALELNEDLTEAIALGHDLGHTPFGHAGEKILQKLHPDGFRHERQSLRVVDRLENEGKGLNLTLAVRDGIINHSKGLGPLLDSSKSILPKTLEGQIVRLSDLIAYINHDLDDSLRAKVLKYEDMPDSIKNAADTSRSGRLTFMIEDIVENTTLAKGRHIAIGPENEAFLEEVRTFLYDRVYYNDKVHCEFKKATMLIEHLWEFFLENLDRFYEEYWPRALKDGKPQDDIRDFIAGMTDAFATTLFQKIYTPKRWYIY